jgi:hypothetical protein
MLVACGPVEEDGATTTGGTDVTDEGVEISLGSGTGSDFNEGIMSTTVTNLSAGGTTAISVNIVNVASNNSLYSGLPVTIAFQSQCVESGLATFSTENVTTSSGIATTTYQAEGCVGNDTITAKYKAATASVTVAVSPADVNSIGVNEISTNTIAYGDYGTSTYPNISIVSFILSDDRGNPVNGQTVEFEISSADDNHGATLSNTSDTSDNNGIVETRLNAGALATSLRVIATFTSTSGDSIATTTSSIVVNTGPPTSERSSISATTFAVHRAADVDNMLVEFALIGADKNGNNVADGTAVQFWAEQGRIYATCGTLDGICGSKWLSGGVRPADGKTTGAAMVVGEDSYKESGIANGLYDIGETLISEPEFFYDVNFNGILDAGEAYIDYNNNNTYDASSTKYRGTNCSAAALGDGHCAESSVLVWEQTEICQLSEELLITPLGGPNWGPGIHYVEVTDLNGNYPPRQTSIVLDGGEVDVVVDNAPDVTEDQCETVPHIYRVEVIADAAGDSDTLLITINTPSGFQSYNTDITVTE